MAWTSTDGRAWDTVGVPPPESLTDTTGMPDDFEARGSRMGQLVRLDETLYSFGLFNFMDFVRPVGWRWTDGEEWQFIDSRSDFYASGSVADVVGSDGRLVAARSELTLSWSGADSTIWVWSAATSWRRADLSDDIPDRVFVTEVATDGDGYLASGLIPVPGAQDPVGSDVGVWSSADGLAWGSIESPAGSLEICALEADPAGGFIAMGFGADGVTVWRLVDGEWTETVLGDLAPDRAGISGGYYRRCRLVPLDAATLAFFRRDDGSVESWSSADGSSWTGRGVVAEDAQHIAGGGDRVVIVSAEDTGVPGGDVTIQIGRVTQ